MRRQNHFFLSIFGVVGKLEHFLFLIFDSTGIVLPVRKSPSDKRHGPVAVKDGPVQFPKY